MFVTVVSESTIDIVVRLYLFIFVVFIVGCYKHDSAGSIANSHDGSIRDSDITDEDAVRTDDGSISDSGVADDDVVRTDERSDSDLYDGSIRDSDMAGGDGARTGEGSEGCLTENSAIVKWTFRISSNIGLPLTGSAGALFVPQMGSKFGGFRPVIILLA